VRVQEGGAFPRWPTEPALHDLADLILHLSARAAGQPLPTIAPWPNGYLWALVLTHDVEPARGRDTIGDVQTLELQCGYRSSWNLVPERCDTDEGTEVRRGGSPRPSSTDATSVKRTLSGDCRDAGGPSAGERTAFAPRDTGCDWMPLLGCYDSSYRIPTPTSPSRRLPFLAVSSTRRWWVAVLPQDHPVRCAGRSGRCGERGSSSASARVGSLMRISRTTSSKKAPERLPSLFAGVCRRRDCGRRFAGRQRVVATRSETSLRVVDGNGSSDRRPMRPASFGFRKLNTPVKSNSRTRSQTAYAECWRGDKVRRERRSIRDLALPRILPRAADIPACDCVQPTHRHEPARNVTKTVAERAPAAPDDTHRHRTTRTDTNVRRHGVQQRVEVVRLPTAAR
jgi:hypothetical protein